MFAFDGAYAAPLVAQCKAAGGVAMVHYLTGIYVTTSPQVAATRASGMGAVFGYEQGASELVGATRAQGQAVGRRAVNAIPPECPLDRTVKIYFAVDTEVLAGNIGACDEAFRGIRDVIGAEFRVGVYGQLSLIDHLVGQRLVDGKQWLMASTFGLPYTPWTNVAMVQQHDGTGTWLDTPVPNTDVNTILDIAELGAWWPVGSPHLPTPRPVGGPTMLATVTVVDGKGQPIPAAQQVRCVFGAGLHAHNDPISAGVVARVADAGSINQAQHDRLAAAVVPPVVAPSPVSVDVASLASDLAAPLAAQIAAHVTLAAK